MSLLPLLLTLADELGDLQTYPSNADYRRCQHHGCPSRQMGFPGSKELEKRKMGKINQGVTVGKEGYQISMDVQQFRPNELSVKTVDNTVVVEGKHEEREDEHGYISRHFIRKYVLPDGYDPNQVVSTLSSDGLLTISVPPPSKAENNERVIQIQQTGPAHLSVKDNPKEETKEEKEDK